MEVTSYMWMLKKTNMPSRPKVVVAKGLVIVLQSGFNSTGLFLNRVPAMCVRFVG